MPPPVVYIVVVIAATVAAGITLFTLVKNGSNNGSRNSRRGRMNRPHDSGNNARDDAPPRNDSGGPTMARQDGLSGVEMRDLRQSASAVRSPAMGSDLRNRRTRSSENEASMPLLDGSITDIPYTPLAPTPAPRGDATPTASTPAASPPTSPFALGLSSPFSTPSHAQLRSLETSPLPSPPVRALDFPTQLPTPAYSEASSPAAQVTILPPTDSESHSDSEPVPAPAAAQAEDPFSSETQTLHAPSMSWHPSEASSSVLSFSTALSPTTEYTALSPPPEFQSFPPTQPTSPFSEPLTLSGDDEMYSFGSASGSGSSSVGSVEHANASDNAGAGGRDLHFNPQSPPQSEDGFVHDFDIDAEGSEDSGDSWEELDAHHGDAQL